MKTSIYENLQGATVKSVNGMSINVVNLIDGMDNYIASLEVAKSYGDVKVSVLVHVFEEGYRTAVVFNDLHDEEYAVVELEDDLDLSEYSEKMNKGICAIQKHNVLKFVGKVLTELEEQVNNILGDIDDAEVTAAENSAFQEELEQEEIDLERELEEPSDNEDVFGDPELGHHDISDEDVVDTTEEDDLSVEDLLNS